MLHGNRRVVPQAIVFLLALYWVGAFEEGMLHGTRVPRQTSLDVPVIRTIFAWVRLANAPWETDVWFP